MPSLTEWKVPAAVQPRADEFAFDLEATLEAVVGLHCIVPEDAFTAQTLGTERAGNGVLIDKGLILTIGYLITEAETIWVHLGDGRVVPGHALGVDPESGFGLVQALGKLNLPVLDIGDTDSLRVGDSVVFAASGGRRHAVATKLVCRQEFIERCHTYCSLLILR